MNRAECGALELLRQHRDKLRDNKPANKTSDDPQASEPARSATDDAAKTDRAAAQPQPEAIRPLPERNANQRDEGPSHEDLRRSNHHWHARLLTHSAGCQQ